jgi:hypothetical protein
MGRLIPSPHFDGLLPLWQHIDCLFASTQVDKSWIQGWDKLTKRETSYITRLCTDVTEQTHDGGDDDDVPIVVHPPTRTMIKEVAKLYIAAEQASHDDAYLTTLLAQLPANQLPALLRLLMHR